MAKAKRKSEDARCDLAPGIILAKAHIKLDSISEQRAVLAAQHDAWCAVYADAVRRMKEQA